MGDYLIDRSASGTQGELEGAQENFQDRSLDLTSLEDGPSEPVLLKRRLVENERNA